MSNLVWDPTDVALVLEAMPAVDADWFDYHYTVDRDGLSLRIVVSPSSGYVDIYLYRDGVKDPIFSIPIRDCAEIRRVYEKKCEYLEFTSAPVFDRRHSSAERVPFGVRLSIKPSLSISLF